MGSNKSKAKNAKANNAMAISAKFEEITRLRQMIEVQFREIQAMVASENHPDFDSNEILDLRLTHAESLRSEISKGESRWHNVAFDRGYYDIEAGPRKLSKSDQYK